MRRIITGLLAALLLLTLAACGSKAQGGSGSAEEAEVSGYVNRLGDYLVLLTGDGEYQGMDYGKGVSVDGFAEGDSVEITYTGELGVDGAAPVITAISKVK